MTVSLSMKSSLVGIVAFFTAANAFCAKPNYDESKIPPYTLEDPLVFSDGRRLKDASEWPERRREILNMFAREMYGQPPPAPETVVVEMIEEGVTLAGLGIRRQYRMWFKKDKTGPYIDWLLLLPNNIIGRYPQKDDVGRIVCENKDRCPVVLFLNYRGNHELISDEEVHIQEKWTRNSNEYGVTDNKASAVGRAALRRTSSRSTFPVETILSRGYAVLSACYCEISPDVPVKHGESGFAYTGVFELWGARDMRRTDLTTSLGAWAWALSRGLDLAEMIPELDSRKSVVTGSSRLGKAALLAAARDERFAVCVPNQTGGGGCPLAKHFYGENVSTEMQMFPHWYCAAYAKFANNEQAMPFDQHLLLASIAPRALLVEGFNQRWFDTKGEYLAVKAASPVWEFLGEQGLPDGGFPDSFSTVLIGRSLGYVRRGGNHGLSAFDWRWMLDFADGAFTRGFSVDKQSARQNAFSGPSAPMQRKILEAEGLETTLWQGEIDRVAGQGGGRVVIPAGRHVVGQLNLRSNVELHLEKGAVLEGAVGLDYYEVAALPYSEGTWSAIISAIGATNVAVTGEGEIFGNGSKWARPKKLSGNQEGQRARGMLFADCCDVRLEGFTLRDAACWGIVFKCCNGVIARGVKIDSHANANSDGFDIEASNVLIEDCQVDSGDDAFCIKSNNPKFIVENVIVRRCIGRTCCNAFKIGTASHGIVRNVRFEDCTGAAPAREGKVGLTVIVAECVDGGIVEDIVFKNIDFTGFRVPIFIRGGRRKDRWCGTPPSNKYIFRDVTVENVRGCTSSPKGAKWTGIASSVTGVDGCRIAGVKLKDIDIVYEGIGEEESRKAMATPVPDVPGAYPEVKMFKCRLPAYGLYADRIDGLSIDNVRFSVKEGTVDLRPCFMFTKNVFDVSERKNITK